MTTSAIPYGHQIQTGSPFDEARAVTVDALNREGFGVLTEIDVKETLRKKLNRDFRRYVILGACRPDLALRGLETELALGLLLPCNVALWAEEHGTTTVALLRPDTMERLAGNPALDPMVREADERLRRVMDEIRTRTRSP